MIHARSSRIKRNSKRCRWTGLARLAGLLALLPLAAAAQRPETATGRRLAETVCAACHQVEANPTAPSPNPDAPRFGDVARMASTTELSLRVFLRSTHPTMPNFILSANEIESLSSYILSLANR